jgi:hypothetical protein
MIAALFVETNGPYFGLPNVDPWDKPRNALLYPGPWPVVCHSPCERWGRYAEGGPNPKAARQKFGDDGGCFEFALNSVIKYGGVLEHPAHSGAWPYFGITAPPPDGHWVSSGDFRGGWVCHVEQGHYGHPARKATWLYARSRHLPIFEWGASVGVRIDEGFHSSEERARARAAGIGPIKRISRKNLIYTPAAFRDHLVRIAELSR